MWWLTDPERFVREQDEIDAVVGSCDWLIRTEWKVGEGVSLRLEFDFKVGDRTYEGVLVYPAMFPDVAAYILPRNPGETWSATHQYGGSEGVLCLQWGPDNWQTNVTGAMLVRSAYELIATESRTAGVEQIVPSRHHLTIGQRTRSAKWRLVLTQGLQEAIGALADGSQRSAKFSSTQHTVEWVHYCRTILDGETVVFADTSIPAMLRANGEHPIFVYPDDGWLFKSSAFSFSSTPETPEDLLEQIKAGGFGDFAWPVSATPGKATTCVVLLANTSKETRCYFVATGGEKPSTQSIACIEANQSHANRSPADKPQWEGKAVGIVGLGSVGTKVAKSLVRQGIRKLVLIEDDVLLPENIVRNDLDWLYVGLSKADALKEALSLIEADVEVEVYEYRVAGQENARIASNTLEILAKCNLIVDATANHKVFNYLASVSQRHKIPMVWGEVFAGGIGSLMARSRPGTDPGPLSTREQIRKYLEDKPKAPFQSAENYDADADDGTPIVASDGEVGQFAYMLTRLAIDSLRDPTAQEFPYSAYLVGFKAAWIFTAPFDTRPIATTLVPEMEPQKKQPDEAIQKKWYDSVMKLFKVDDANPKSAA